MKECKPRRLSTLATENLEFGVATGNEKRKRKKRRMGHGSWGSIANKESLNLDFCSQFAVRSS